MIPLDPRIPQKDSPNFLVRLYELFKDYAKEINSILLTVKGRLLSVDAGSASAPSVSFDGDENTGIYSPGADQIGISTGGTSRMTIDSSGNVGIGGTPTTKLDVITSANSGIRVTDGTQIGIMYASAHGGIAVGTTSNHPYILLTNNSERMRIDSSGVVSIVSGQIKVPATQNASADANTLDDYEEGDWVPILVFQIPGTSSFTYATQSGKYTKIGRQVTVVFDIQLSAFTAGTASGLLAIQPLPFTSGSVKASGVLGLVENFTTVYPTAVVTEPGYAFGYFLSHLGDGSPSYLTPSNVSATSHIVGTITYFV